MAVTIRKMTDREYERFCRWSMEQQAQELMEESRLSREEALRQAKDELSRMLPEGAAYEGQFSDDDSGSG